MIHEGSRVVFRGRSKSGIPPEHRGIVTNTIRRSTSLVVRFPDIHDSEGAVIFDGGYFVVAHHALRVLENKKERK